MKNLDYNAFKTGTDLCDYVNNLDLEVVSILVVEKSVYPYKLFYHKGDNYGDKAIKSK